ncbi:hypothetical protein [Streptomyces botrytidirepellens]|uniref:Uncharacterized protein n=1 Tax=Streptomyces botrytidirepellens TaxID=2486417 RepID=A0A3M8S963_9ACTN|nr:hypothetical protein [Streptomyces botrytidirepellens]RNF77668.1 hypothetical protein EEJ42_49940 [Streptomyces botrytidirepellens]
MRTTDILIPATTSTPNAEAHQTPHVPNQAAVAGSVMAAMPRAISRSFPAANRVTPFDAVSLAALMAATTMEIAAMDQLKAMLPMIALSNRRASAELLMSLVRKEMEMRSVGLPANAAKPVTRKRAAVSPQEGALAQSSRMTVRSSPRAAAISAARE